MKKFLLLFAFLFIFFSCIVDDDLPTYSVSNLPEWLQPQVEQLEASSECGLWSVTRISYKGESYYNVYSAYMSCIYCGLKDSEGNEIDFSEEEWNEFIAAEKTEVVVWRCSKTD